MAWLFLLLIVAPLVELYVIIQVAQVIGGWETIALLIIESAIGAWLLKRQGLSTLGKISQAVDQGRVPSKELVDGLLLLVAGALMLAPGFLGDVIGYLLLLPPTRAPIRALLVKRFAAGRYGSFFAASGPGGTRFVGTFRAGRGATFDTTGRATPGAGGELEP
ncbi:MAG: FxsA family protein [Acidimicrobiales bacterium]|nr:FxsA family protein [Acidimicrobiales bacterium]HRW37374.1 FxsA family protein [Aquihabitans sp.]